MSKALISLGWREYGPVADNSKYTFVVLTGRVADDQRASILAAYNSASNARGEIIMAILVSVVAAQGIELKCTRSIHIVEFGWNYSLFEQIVARCVRMNSHADLPEDERTLSPYVYIAVLPDTYNVDATESTDEYMYNRACANMQLINTFRLAIAEAAIDCLTFNTSTLLTCMVCKPTGQRLYEYDINEDMRHPCICQPYKATAIRAERVELDGVAYYKDVATGKLHEIV